MADYRINKSDQKTAVILESGFVTFHIIGDKIKYYMFPQIFWKYEKLWKTLPYLLLSNRKKI